MHTALARWRGWGWMASAGFILPVVAGLTACRCSGVELPLRAGWNLVALPEAPLDPRVESVVASAGASLVAVWTQRHGVWLGYAPADPALSDLVDMNGREGYWIQVRTSTVLRYLGSGTTPTATSLQAGWNLVGANGFVELPPDQAFAGIGVSLDSAWTQDGDWRVYRPAGGTQGAAGALAETGTTTAYWVHVSAAALWDRASPAVLPPAVPPATERLEVGAAFAVVDPVSLSLPDGTGVTLEALDTPVAAVLSRETVGLASPAAGLEATGSLRVLTLTSDVALPFGRVPRIVIPRSERGAIDPQTLWVARVGDVVGEEGIVADAVLVLPVRYDAAGNLVAHDVFFTDTVAAAADAARRRRGPVVTRIAYIPLSFQKHANLYRSAHLLRMVPHAATPCGRRVLSELLPAIQAAENRRPVQNVVVFVHGHNETEGNGLRLVVGAQEAPEPWVVDYKMDVWTFMYRELLRETAEGERVYGDLLECTRFYEFIYPSWQSIYESLGPSLARLMEKEFEPQLKAGLGFNLFVAAHSMGGLVARAGLNEMDSVLDPCLQKLTTWGSPHHGAAMYTLSAMAHAEPAYKAIYVTDVAWNSARSKLAAMAMDTPGMRDLRWDNSRPLVLQDWFSYGLAQQADDTLFQAFDFGNGPWLYSHNTAILNQRDRHARAGCLRNKLNDYKYRFMYGITSKQAGSYTLRPPEAQPLLYRVFAAKPPIVELWDRLAFLDIGAGATANRWLIRDPATPFRGHLLGDSDGAVPVTSMMGEGLIVETHNLGDVDHEEYYGAPLVIDEAGNREPRAEDKAWETAAATFAALKITNPIYACPEVRIENPPDGTPHPPTAEASWTFPLRGRLIWPGDAKPGLRLKAKGVSKDDVYVEARLLFAAPPKYPSWASRTPEQMGFVEVGRNWYATRWRGREETSKRIDAAPDGSFLGSFTLPAYQADFAAGIEVRALLKDGTRVDGYSLFSGLALPHSIATPECTITIREAAGLSHLLRSQQAGGTGVDGFQADFPEAGSLISLAFTIRPAPEWVGHILQVYWRQFAGGNELVIDRTVTADDVAAGFALNREAVFPGYALEATGDFNPDGTQIYEALDRFSLMIVGGSTVTISPSYRPETVMSSGSGREGP